MQLYLDEQMRIFVLRQMKSIESIIMQEYSEDSIQHQDAKEKRAIIDEKIASVFESAKKRDRRK